MNHIIKTIKAREILDSRGNPTLEVRVTLESGISACASVPSGASKGAGEAMELRDGDGNRYSGLGVQKAVKNVNTKIAQLFKGKNVNLQQSVDTLLCKLDGTNNKSNLGANATLSVSLACARAGAIAAGLPLYKYLRQVYHLNIKSYKMPQPMMNIFNGGKHADTNLDFQEFMIIPHLGARGLKFQKFSEKIRAGAEIFHELGKVLRWHGLDTDVGSEGGYAPDIESSMQALDLIVLAINNAGYKPGAEVSLGVDVGAATLYDKRTNQYLFKLDEGYLDSNQLISLYHDWIKKYPIISIEDGLDENDWTNWTTLTKELGKQIQLVGDDLFTTNVNSLKKGVDLKAANAVLVKPNQIGTLLETIEFVELARHNKMKIIVSHRSGETNDDFIADFAVAVNADMVKFGSLARGERVAKWNRLMEIEGELK